MKFRLATKDDDRAIRILLRDIELSGMLQIAYHREPSFFKALEKQGGDYFVLVGTVNDEVKALVTRSIQFVTINSEKYKVAYLSNLRYHQDFRNGISLIKGLRALEEASKENPADFHYATLIDDDKKVKKILAGNRLSMPKHNDLGRIFTYTLPLKKKKLRLSPNSSYSFTKAQKEDFSELETFLKEESKNSDFFPEDILARDSTLLDTQDYFIMKSTNRIVAVCTIKDINECKQFILEGYSKRFGFLRTLLNLYLQLIGRYSIPARKQPIKFIFSGYSVVKDNNPQLFSFLLKFIYSEFSGTKYHFLSLAFHEGNQLNNCLKKYTKVCYKSRLYLLELKHDKEQVSKFKDGIRNCFVDLLRL